MNDFISASSYCQKVFDGTHDTPKPTKKGYPLITSKNILGNNIDLMDSYNISEEDYISIQKRSRVKKWDILFSMIGTVGETYIEINDRIPYAIKNIGVFSCNDEYKAKWLFYYLNSPYSKKFIKNYLGGAVQNFLPLGTLRDFPVIPFNTDKKGCIDLLFSLDSKISLNINLNHELEDMAKTIYDYWFVQFDFPDENGNLYKSSGGKMIWHEEFNREIPEGWDVKKVEEVLEVSLGGTPSTSIESYWDNGSFNWLDSGEVAEFPIVNSKQRITREGIDSSATELLPKGTTLLSITRHLRPTILGIDSCANQSVVGIKEKGDIRSYYIYPYLINS